MEGEIREAESAGAEWIPRSRQTGWSGPIREGSPRGGSLQGEKHNKHSGQKGQQVGRPTDKRAWGFQNLTNPRFWGFQNLLERMRKAGRESQGDQRALTTNE